MTRWGREERKRKRENLDGLDGLEVLVVEVVGLLYWEGERREGGVREGTCVAWLDWVEGVVLVMLCYDGRLTLLWILV